MSSKWTVALQKRAVKSMYPWHLRLRLTIPSHNFKVNTLLSKYSFVVLLSVWSVSYMVLFHQCLKYDNSQFVRLTASIIDFNSCLGCIFFLLRSWKCSSMSVMMLLPLCYGIIKVAKRMWNPYDTALVIYITGSRSIISVFLSHCLQQIYSKNHIEGSFLCRKTWKNFWERKKANCITSFSKSYPHCDTISINVFLKSLKLVSETVDFQIQHVKFSNFWISLQLKHRLE